MAEKGALLTSTFAPEALYVEFEEFLERHQGMVSQYGMNYVWVYMLVRLARDDIQKARRVFDWAVKRTCMNMLSNEQLHTRATEISPQGLHWAKQAEKQFGTNPRKSLITVETVFLLERISVWAEEKFLINLHFRGTSLLEFRQRTPDNEETSGKMDWLDLFYQQARVQAIEDTEKFVRRRDCAIALAITSLAAGATLPPADEEIEEAMAANLPTHQSLARLAQPHVAPFVGGSMISQGAVVEWILGPYTREIPF